MKPITVIMQICFVMLFGCLAIMAENDVELPPNYIHCSKSAPTTERNKCLKENIQNLATSLQTGFSPLNIPAIEPYSLSKVRFKYNDASLSFDIELENLKIHGVSKLDVISVRSKFDEPKILLEVKVVFPKVRFVSDYHGTANVVDVNIQPKGQLDVILNNMSNTYKVTAMVEKRDNDEYVVLKKFDITAIDIKDFKSKINGLVPDPVVNNFLLEFINQNWRNLYPLIIKRTKSTWEPLVLGELNDVYKRIPYRQVVAE